MSTPSRPSHPRISQAIATLVAILGTLIVNTLSNFYPPRGMNVGEISNTLFRDVAIIPASYAFIIWGVIYVGLIAYGIYQLQAPQRHDNRIVNANRYLIGACLIQILWIYLFTMQWFWASVIAMLGILGALIQAYRSLGIGQQTISRRRQWFTHIPFSLYLGWISVATIVNVASALFNAGLQSNSTLWSIALLIIGGGLATQVLWQRSDVVFGLVFVWAYVAIANAQAPGSPVSITAIIVALGIVALIVRHRKQGTNRDNPLGSS